MKKMNKLIMLATLPLLLSGCFGKGGGGIVLGEKTINIKLHLGGYRYEWLNQLIAKFEDAYKEEGYKVNLLKPGDNGGDNVVNEFISGYDQTKVDLYFAGNLYPQKFYDKKANEMLALPIDELVYDQKAIGFNGEEENKTVREKLDSSFGDEFYKYNGSSYNFFYQKSVGALAVNRVKLQSLGYEIPVTSNQFLDTIHGIYKKNASGDTKIRPFSMMGGTSGYPSVMMNSWFTQISGIDNWNRFWSMNNADGSYNTQTGYEVFTDRGLHIAAQTMYEAFDQYNIVKGASSYDINAAHSALMKSTSGGVFMFDGDWLLNESSADYSNEQLSALSFINVPIHSEVGNLLWGSVISDATVRDNVLAKVATLSDQGNEVSEIKATIQSEFSYDLTENSIEEACKARGIYNNRGALTGTCYVPKDIPEEHKGIVGKLLRMFASDDFSKLYFETAKCVSPYSTAESFDGVEMLEFSKGHAAIVSHKYATAIWPLTKGLRNKISTLNDMFPISHANLHDRALLNTETAYDSDGNFDKTSKCYETAAEKQLKLEYDQVTTNWSKWTEGL